MCTERDSTPRHPQPGWTEMLLIALVGLLGSHCLDVTTQPNEPDQLLKEVKFPRFSEKNPD